MNEPGEGIVKSAHDSSMILPEKGNEGPYGKMEDTLGDFAEDLGKLLGSAQNKAQAWLSQRQAIADQLTQIRDTANKYLQQLSGGQRVTTPSMLAKEVARRGRPPGSGARKTGRIRKLSAAARKRISEAQKARWAKQRKAE